MTENVFRPSRRVGGRRVRSRLFSGRYSLARGEKPVTVSLDTPDEQVARKRLRDLIVEKQREAVGRISPRAIRETLATPLPELLVEYEAYLRSCDLSAGYLRDTIRRIERIVHEAGWKFVGDVRPDSFLKWRANLAGSAKTNKEYQVSLGAFLNWLVKVERLERNPLAKIEHVETRGKQVRPYRAFSEEELRRLFASAGPRVLAYRTMLYTGQRPEEVADFRWSDLHLDEARPFVLVREESTKDKEKRAIPLRPELASLLRAARPAGVDEGARVFATFPTRKQLLRDMVAAGIERKDGSGRSLHLRSFRKTWQTMGVRHGVNQRSAQAILGHSDANLTANVYTDVPALALHDEMAKVPWLDNAQGHSLKPGENDPSRDLVKQIVELVRVYEKQAFSEGKSDTQPLVGEWSGRQDSNLRPPGPKPGALPG
jgi:integrase